MERKGIQSDPEFAYSDHKRQVEEMLERQRAEHPQLGQLVFRPGTILGEQVANPITAMFDRPLVIGVWGSSAPFSLIWDEDVARCILKGIAERRTGTYNLAGPRPRPRSTRSASGGSDARSEPGRARDGEVLVREDEIATLIRDR